MVLKIVLLKSTTSFSKITRQFHKFKSGKEDLKDLDRKQHPIIETSQVNTEGLGLFSKMVIGVLMLIQKLRQLFLIK